MEKKENTLERLARIEAHLEFIKENMADKATLMMLKWGIGGVGSLAVTALLFAAKVNGGN